MKNELAKAKAEWAREKKRMVMEHEGQVEERVKDFEMERDVSVKEAKLVVERAWKKKFDEREAVLEERLREIDSEMTNISSKHAEELKRERERIELRLRESIRVEVRNEVADQMTEEFAAEMQKTQDIH